MATAYTPGLAVSPAMKLLKSRRLPIPGEVLVREGQTVEAETVVARTQLPGKVHLINVAGTLSIPEGELESYLRVKKGQLVEEGEVLAETKGLFGLFKSQCRAPVRGVVESFSTVTGQVVLREPPVPLEVTAYVRGRIVQVFPDEGVVVETTAAVVQGIFGVGGETGGPLALAADRPEDPLTADRLASEHRGCVVVGGGRIAAEAVQRAREVGVLGLVAGSIDAEDLGEILGYELGVAITGHEAIGVTLIVTEGFGTIPMSERTFSLLRSLVGERASINGATQIRAGVQRPEVIVPRPESVGEGVDVPPPPVLEVGSRVRLIREPGFGRVGTVQELPVAPTAIPTEAVVRVARVRLDSGETVTLPRANLELIQE